MCWAKEFRFYVLSNGEPLKILEQGMAFLEKDESGHGLWGGVLVTESPVRKKMATTNGPCAMVKQMGGQGRED